MRHRPAELCIDFMHVNGACPSSVATSTERECLAAAGIELPSVEVLQMINTMGDDMLFDMLMMGGGGDPSHNQHMGAPLMGWDEGPMDWDTTMPGATDLDEVDFESDDSMFDLLGEVGMLSTDDSDSSVYYAGSYADPVIFAGIPTGNGADGQPIVRIRSIDTTAGTITFYVRHIVCIRTALNLSQLQFNIAFSISLLPACS